jgi:hypothetical protein
MKQIHYLVISKYDKIYEKLGTVVELPNVSKISNPNKFECFIDADQLKILNDNYKILELEHEGADFYKIINVINSIKDHEKNLEKYKRYVDMLK